MGLKSVCFATWGGWLVAQSLAGSLPRYEEKRADAEKPAGEYLPPSEKASNYEFLLC